jgi:hypothetical protein
MFERHKTDPLFPAAIVREDERLVYRRMLREAKKRQEERDAMHMAWIDNLFHGKEYVSIFEEYPDMAELTEEHKKEIKDAGHPKHDAGLDK